MDDAVVDLWISVLWQAAYDYHLRYGADELDQADAKDWFDDWRVYTGSFLWICRHLDIDPELVRDAGRPIKSANQKAHSLQEKRNPEKNGFRIWPQD